MHNLLFDKKRLRVKHCPCGKSNKDGKFVPYTGFEIEGYCHSCGKLFLPGKDTLPQAANAYLYKHLSLRKGTTKRSHNTRQIASVAKSSPAMTTHPFNLVKQSCQSYEHNNFAIYLTTLFGQLITTELLHRYHIGTSNHWNGSTVFWQIDFTNSVRAGKIMLYNSITGKRVKEPFSHIAWAHRILKLNDYKLKQCFFGAHLLKQDRQKPVAIAESEKTAVIASVHLPQFIWLATGSVSHLTEEKCAVLRGRNVVLFPDANAFEKWRVKAKELSHITRFTVSDLLEKNTTADEKLSGLDLGDYLG